MPGAVRDGDRDAVERPMRRLPAREDALFVDEAPCEYLHVWHLVELHPRACRQLKGDRPELRGQVANRVLCESVWSHDQFDHRHAGSLRRVAYRTRWHVAL